MAKVCVLYATHKSGLFYFSPRLGMPTSIFCTALVFSRLNGTCVYTLKSANVIGFVSACALSKLSNIDDIVALTAHQDGIGRLWNASRLGEIKEVTLIGHTDVLTSCAFLDGETHTALTSSCDKTVKIWFVALRTTRRLSRLYASNTTSFWNVRK